MIITKICFYFWHVEVNQPVFCSTISLGTHGISPRPPLWHQVRRSRRGHIVDGRKQATHGIVNGIVLAGYPNVCPSTVLGIEYIHIVKMFVCMCYFIYAHIDLAWLFA